MADSYNNIITGRFKGLLGKQLVFRNWAGKTVVAKAPTSRTSEPSPDQLKLQEKFLIASKYAKAIVSSDDKSLATAYATVLRPRQNVYSRALEDYLTPPDVKSINTESYTGAVGDKVTVLAIDDFRVTQLRVEIYSASGALLEAGNALQQINGIDWIYTATLANNQKAGSKIKAIATDVPGNKGTLEVTV